LFGGFVLVDVEIVQHYVEFTGGVRLHNIVHETEKIDRRAPSCKLPLIGRIIHGQRHPVGPVFQRRAAQFPQRVLQSVAQALEAFRITQRDVLPV